MIYSLSGVEHQPETVCPSVFGFGKRTFQLKLWSLNVCIRILLGNENEIDGEKIIFRDGSILLSIQMRKFYT